MRYIEGVPLSKLPAARRRAAATLVRAVAAGDGRGATARASSTAT